MSEAPTARPSNDAGLGIIGRLAFVLAVLGGVLSIAIALLVLTSITLRQTPMGAVRGDFELVQMGIALAVFAFLPWCQARRGNVMVDTFTTWLPRRVQAGLDALWDMVLAGMMALLAWRLALGGLDAMTSSTTTMVLLLPIGPAILACAALAGFLALVSLATAVARWRAP